MLRLIYLSLTLALLAAFAGCYQAESDSAMQIVPVTNNPHVITDSNRNSTPAGVGY